MIAFARRHLTYANTMATIAVVLALGGTSYAALTLPRNSVGSDQIRNSSIRSSDIRDRTIQLTDISKTTRNSLRGARGPQGTQGPAGTAAVRYFAAVASGGNLARGNATTDSHPVVGSGDYVVGFGASTAACGYSATLGSTDGSPVPAGRITVKASGDNVEVNTYDAAGAPADLPFFLIAAC